ncbi:MAG: 50S ribosomal protein L29 [Patescibacteria group bacterium]
MNYSEIAQLSDRDLSDEVENTRGALFRQKMGLRTKHLKDSHLIKILKKYLAQLLTESTRRAKSGQKIEKTNAAIEKKKKDFAAELVQQQTVKKEKASGKKIEKSDDAEIEKKSSSDVKVKKVAKKGLFKKSAQ